MQVCKRGRTDGRVLWDWSQFVPVSRVGLLDKAVWRADWFWTGSTPSTGHRGKWRRGSRRNRKTWRRYGRGTRCGFYWTCTGTSGVGLGDRTRLLEGSGSGRYASATVGVAGCDRTGRGDAVPLWIIALFARARALDVVNTGWSGRDRCMAMGCSWIVRVLCSWRVASGVGDG